jgi:hypothetical protein
MMDPLTVVQQKIILVILLYARVGGTLKYYLYSSTQVPYDKTFLKSKGYQTELHSSST